MIFCSLLPTAFGIVHDNIWTGFLSVIPGSSFIPPVDVPIRSTCYAFDILLGVLGDKQVGHKLALKSNQSLENVIHVDSARCRNDLLPYTNKHTPYIQCRSSTNINTVDTKNAACANYSPLVLSVYFEVHWAHASSLFHCFPWFSLHPLWNMTLEVAYCSLTFGLLSTRLLDIESVFPWFFILPDRASFVCSKIYFAWPSVRKYGWHFKNVRWSECIEQYCGIVSCKLFGNCVILVVYSVACWRKVQ